jgi:hypothetical protein
LCRLERQNGGGETTKERKGGSSSAKKFQHSQAQRTKTLQAGNKFLTQIEIED